MAGSLRQLAMTLLVLLPGAARARIVAADLVAEALEWLRLGFRFIGQRQRFDVDRPGKDSYRHREAGATEVLLASSHRLALLREYDAEGLPSLHDLVAELSPVDWVLAEGFKHADWPKVEVWRAACRSWPIRFRSFR